MDPDDVGLLYVSDDPETFAGHGRLFSAKLPTDGRPVRILFDHVNGTTSPPGTALRVIVALVNTSPGTTGNLLVAGRDAGPPHDADVNDATNGMHVGHVATMRFLQTRLLADDAGEVRVQMPFGQPHAISSRVLQPPAPGNVKNVGECTAGIFDVQAIETGIGYELRVMAVDPNSDATVWQQLPPATSAKDFKFRSGVFDIKGGGDPVTIPFGASATYGDRQYSRDPQLDSDHDPTHVHKGEFGVVKHFTCAVGPGESGFLYQSTGAPGATATYLLGDGTVLVSSRFAKGDRRDKIAALQPPSVDVVTMAEINSSLAVTLETGPDDPQIADAGQPGSKITVVA